jgi:hypothetical protein
MIGRVVHAKVSVRRGEHGLDAKYSEGVSRERGAAHGDYQAAGRGAYRSTHVIRSVASRWENKLLDTEAGRFDLFRDVMTRDKGISPDSSVWAKD